MAQIAFGGQQIRRPGAYSVVDSSQMTPSSVGSFKVLGFVGHAPNAGLDAVIATAYAFNSQNIKEAVALLGAGELIDNMKTAWKYGADLIVVSVASKGAIAPTDAEWESALATLETEFVDGIVVVNTAVPILLKAVEHVSAMSNTVNRKERRVFAGHEASKTVENIKTDVMALSNSRLVYASPAVYELGADGSKVLKDSVLLASAYAGLWASKESQDPLTYDYVAFAGLEKQYSATDIGDLIEAGITVCETVRGKGIRIVQAVTTSSSEDLTERELSVSTLKDDMSTELRTTLEDKHVGNAGVAGIEVTIYNDSITILEGFKKKGWISEYIPESVKVVKNATAFTVEWEGKPTLPINNFLITSHFSL